MVSAAAVVCIDRYGGFRNTRYRREHAFAHTSVVDRADAKRVIQRETHFGKRHTSGTGATLWAFFTAFRARHKMRLRGICLSANASISGGRLRRAHPSERYA
jgi:hypothetical protein